MLARTGARLVGAVGAAVDRGDLPQVRAATEPIVQPVGVARKVEFADLPVAAERRRVLIPGAHRGQGVAVPAGRGLFFLHQVDDAPRALGRVLRARIGDDLNGFEAAGGQLVEAQGGGRGLAVEVERDAGIAPQADLPVVVHGHRGHFLEYVRRRTARAVEVFVHVEDGFAQLVDHRRFFALYDHTAQLHGGWHHQPLPPADYRGGGIQRGRPADGPVSQRLGPDQVLAQREVGQRKGAVFRGLGIG